jgi:ABC-type transporter Mla subunit MlaD
MAETGPAGPPRDPFENIISIVAGPIAAVLRSFDQMRRGTDELIKGMENFNRTMQNLNVTAERVNALLNEFEQPVRAILPQVTRTVNLAEELASRVSGPVDQVVPGLTRLADTLNSPVLTSLPNDLGRFVEAINDLVRRLSPLGQLAESATGLFGIRIPGVPRPAAPPPPTIAAPRPEKKAAPKKKAAAKKPAAKKSAGKRKQPAKRSPSQR